MSRSRSHVSPAYATTAALLLGSLTAEPLATETLGQASPVLVEVALAELDRLARPNPGRPPPDQLLIRNLSRYFTTYPVPPDAEAAGALLEAARQAGVGWSVAALELAAREAAAAGRETIGRDHVRRSLARLLPSRVGEFDDVVFFPTDETAAVSIETADLMAFMDTGFGWDVVLGLAALEVSGAREPPPIERPAVLSLTSGVSAYSLLVLRLAGRLARLDHAPHADAGHVERARLAVADRVAGRPSEGLLPTPTSAGSVFTDVSTTSGLVFRHRTSPWLSRFRRYGTFAPTFSGGGITASDLDGDGWQDLLLCGGTGCSLFRNRGDGTFEETTARAGINVPGEARMAIAADLDGDGWKEIFLTYARDTNRLFRGLPDGRFEDVTATSGLERTGDVSGPAVVFDFDGDRMPDLYVGNFGDYLHGRHPWATDNAVNGMPNRLYRNHGGLRFTDVTADAGAGHTGWTQAISHFDHDRDGDQDLYLANDFGRNELLANNGDGTFYSAGRETGSDDPFHGMNVAFADLNHDGYGDIFVTNIWAYRPREERLVESNTLLLSEPDGDLVRYRRATAPWVAQHDTGWAWAAVFLDYDRDGRDDLFIANGFTDYLTFVQHRRHPDDPLAQVPTNNGSEPNFLFRGMGRGSFQHTPASGAEIDGANSRSAVALDYDRDGDADLALTTFHSTARLLRNDLATDGGWLTVNLRHAAAIGSQVRVRAGDEIDVWRAYSGGGGYLAMDAEVAEFGIGTARSADVELTSLGGHRRRFVDVPANRHLTLFP